jgi:hypothetical protein
LQACPPEACIAKTPASNPFASRTEQSEGTQHVVFYRNQQRWHGYLAERGFDIERQHR